MMMMTMMMTINYDDDDDDDDRDYRGDDDVVCYKKKIKNNLITNYDSPLIRASPATAENIRGELRPDMAKHPLWHFPKLPSRGKTPLPRRIQRPSLLWDALPTLLGSSQKGLTPISCTLPRVSRIYPN